MKTLFQDILSLDHVHGVMLLSTEGDPIFEEFSSPPPGGIPAGNGLGRFALTMAGIREADLLFGKKRIYIRKADPGYLLIVMGLTAPAAMVRMNCDMVLPLLGRESAAKQKGLKSFFKKGR